MTPELTQRAFDAAYAELFEAGLDAEHAKSTAEWVTESLRETQALHGAPELLRLAGSEDARYAWSLAFGVWNRNRLNASVVGTSVAAAARVLAEEGQ